MKYIIAAVILIVVAVIIAVLVYRNNIKKVEAATAVVNASVDAVKADLKKAEDKAKRAVDDLKK
jgi:uncharacterized protein YxeA